MHNDKDFELCNGTWRKIADKYNNEPIATDFNDFERIIMLIWTVTGIIENGGFQYLFESEIPGDNNYLLTIDAFKEIGCLGCVEIIKEALSIFPHCKIPTDSDVRLRIYNSEPQEHRDSMDTRFWNEIPNITKSLAEYIKEKQE